jgi:hypothetical protein
MKSRFALVLGGARSYRGLAGVVVGGPASVACVRESDGMRLQVEEQFTEFATLSPVQAAGL